MTAIPAASLSPLVNLHQLEVLQLGNEGVTDAVFAQLRRLTSLRVLDAEGFGNSISDEGLEYLRGMDQLQELHLQA